MVYSQICSWVDDYLLGDAPEELLDTWDFMEWIQETELISVFTEYIIPTFSNSRARKHAVQILMALLWEYYLFRRTEAIATAFCGSEHVLRLLGLAATVQKSEAWYLEKQNILTASEFGYILLTGARHREVVRSKLGLCSGLPNITVSLGHQDSLSWGTRFEPVIKSVYEQVITGHVAELGRIRHPVLTRLGASPDGIVETGGRCGRIVEFKAPVSRKLEANIIPYEYYCQVQVQMEVCDIELADYCECRIVSGSTWSSVASSGPHVVGCVGVIEVNGVWSYAYSPLYPDNDEGRHAAEEWSPEGLVEKHVWQILDWQLITFKRNRRWWSMVGKPAYEQFWKTVDIVRTDPMYFSPEEV
jgi:hypothetical protein